MKPAVDYQKWAAGKSFGLGDFLFFDTDKNHSVVQTYNATTYEQCNYDDAEADDTTEWSATAPQYSSDPVTVPVPLLKVGTTYFFSGNYDGEQCQHGQHFKINVTYGEGLPESLRSPSEASAPASPEDGGADTSVPANFDHPKDTDDGVKPSSRAGETAASESSRGTTSHSTQDEVTEWKNAWNQMDEKDGSSETENDDPFWQKLRLAAERKMGAAKAEKFCEAFRMAHEKLVYKELSSDAAQRFVDYDGL
ncbi:unnamed protein product [Musa hybrid cultivar]